MRSAVNSKAAERIARRLGLRWLRFRAYLNRAVDWLRICLRNGWLGSHKKLNRNNNITWRQSAQAEKRLKRVIGSRRLEGLHLPRGPAATKLLGIEPTGPPGT